MNSSQNYVWRIAKRFFNALPDKTDETAIVEQISDGVTFRGANLWVLIFAIFIACLGLNLNSTAVIIGAMLISPLMGPIIGMGLAVGRADLELLKRSLTNYGVSTVISVLTAALYFQLTPLTEAQSELLARTSPTLYDVLIALFGGAAGILALSTGGKGRHSARRATGWQWANGRSSSAHATSFSSTPSSSPSPLTWVCACCNLSPSSLWTRLDWRS